LGVSDAADPLVEVMNRKLTLMRRKHAQTREYMEMNALRGIVKDGAGTTLYNYFTEFGLEPIEVDFVFGTAGTNIQSKVRSLLRAIEDNLLGETMTTAHALISSEFFDKLISHPKTEEAYKYFSANGGQPLREDMRRAFPFAGLLFEEYNGSVTLSNGTTERLIPAGEGIAFPLGTFDTFTTYGGPANLLETANTVGLPLYARQQIDSKGRWIDLMTEASTLPVNKRPRLAIRLFSSN
ncbi:major capsid protein, partial [Thalassobacter sp. 16PALIMAR09]|uniref:major capsid protein n=1 Tax=Thalassobacter sp. 16PALIMAR09 TaxID=1225651 RepID=UPI00051DE997